MMETLWVFIVTINGIVSPPSDITEEELMGFSFGLVSNVAAMHYVSEEQCNDARNKMVEGQDSVIRGLQGATIEITDCKLTEFTVE